jgi:hypothetical protein
MYADYLVSVPEELIQPVENFLTVSAAFMLQVKVEFDSPLYSLWGCLQLLAVASLFVAAAQTTIAITLPNSL